jgi:membrane-bound serine protease (ClpP class)
MIMSQKISLFLFLFLFFSFSVSVGAENPSVLLVEISGTIDQSTVEILSESMQEAENREAQALILLLDTPGGGLQQTFDIEAMIRASEIPVIGYVYPSGATAWSAGTFILLSTHVSAMANYTIIGSCQPVEIGIEGSRVINDSKTINALVEWIQERARMYGRNETLAEEFITKNRNINATTAQTLGAIELVASSIEDLLKDLDGLTVTLATGNVTLETTNAETQWYTPSLKIQFLSFISNPILTSLLLMLGIFALIFGISSPGYGAEVFGVIAILLSLIGSGFSLSALSIIFIIMGCLLLIIEVFVTPGFGVIGIGGILCLIVGSIFLIPSYPSREWLISREYMMDVLLVTLVIIALIAVFFVFILYKIIQTRNKKIAVGTFIGEKAKTIDTISPEKSGYVRFKGEYWEAKSDTKIEAGTKVIIVGKDETTLIVKPRKK